MSQSGKYFTNSGAGGFVQTLTGNTGGPVLPLFGNINIVGTGDIIVTGTPNTLTISSSGAVADSFPTDSGTATPVLGVLNLFGGNNLISSASGNTVTFDLNGTTNHAVQLGNASGSLTSLVNGTTGQVLHAITGANDPVWSSVSLTADVTGILPIANGGTNASAFATTNGTVYFDGTRLVPTATGTANFVLTSNGAGSAPTYQAVSASGAVTSVSGGNNITISGTATAPIVNVSGTTNHALQLGNATGSLTSLGVAANGQLPIGSAGVDPVLATLTAGSGVSISNGAGTITISQSTTPIIANYTTVNSSPYVVTTTDYYMSVDTSTIAITIQLPNAPTQYRTFIIKDSAGNALTRNITVTTVGGVVLIEGATTFIMNTNYASINLLYDGVGYQIY